MAYLDLNNVFWAFILILIIYMSLKSLLNTGGENVKDVKKPSKDKSIIEKKPPAIDASLSKSPSTDVISVTEEEPPNRGKEDSVEEVKTTEETTEDEESIHIGKETVDEVTKTEKVISDEEVAIKDEGTILEGEESKEETTEDEESTPENGLITELEPVQEPNKPVLYVKKIIPEIKLNPQDHSLDLLSRIIIKNTGSALAMIVKGSIENKLNDESKPNELISSNMALGPHQSITFENSFHLPLNEIQYIKIANIIKNKQPLEVQDVKPTMGVDVRYEGEDGRIFDIKQNYQFDFKGYTWNLYTK